LRRALSAEGGVWGVSVSDVEVLNTFVKAKIAWMERVRAKGIQDLLGRERGKTRTKTTSILLTVPTTRGRSNDGLRMPL
jgi:hypothetical protein